MFGSPRAAPAESSSSFEDAVLGKLASLNNGIERIDERLGIIEQEMYQMRELHASSLERSDEGRQSEDNLVQDVLQRSQRKSRAMSNMSSPGVPVFNKLPVPAATSDKNTCHIGDNARKDHQRRASTASITDEAIHLLDHDNQKTGFKKQVSALRACACSSSADCRMLSLSLSLSSVASCMAVRHVRFGVDAASAAPGGDGGRASTVHS